MTILNLLQTDLHTIFKSILNQNLHTINIKYDNKSSLTRYIVPLNYAMGETKPTQLIIPENKNNSNNIYFGDIRLNNNHFYTTSNCSRIGSCTNTIEVKRHSKFTKLFQRRIN